MARHVATAVVVERLLDEFGHWCRDCRLPSGRRTWFAISWLTRMHVKAELWCEDCGGRDVELSGDDRDAA